MSNKLLGFWIFLGLGLIGAGICFYALWQKRNEEAEQLGAEALVLKQLNRELTNEKFEVEGGRGALVVKFKSSNLQPMA